MGKMGGETHETKVMRRECCFLCLTDLTVEGGGGFAISISFDFRNSVSRTFSRSERAVDWLTSQRILKSTKTGNLYGARSSYDLSWVARQRLEAERHPVLRSRKYVNPPVKYDYQTVPKGPIWVVVARD